MDLNKIIFLMMLLRPEEIVLKPVDIDEINRMASEFLGHQSAQ